MVQHEERALEARPVGHHLDEAAKQGSYARKTDADPNAELRAYKARPLDGIWAASPYLHNGSVPTLAQLLTPAAQRVTSFQVGSNYDQVNIGLATTQTQFNYTYVTTGCSNLNSGNSNCGHEYGTTLSASDKAALLEYLKTL